VNTERTGERISGGESGSVAMKLLTVTGRTANRYMSYKEGVKDAMSSWNQHDLHKNMHVFSSDNTDLGHIAEVYEDSFLLRKGLIFHHDRYFPYSAIASIDHENVHLTLSADDAAASEWGKRPDYEDHLADPLQLFYDRGHGVHDPFDETNPDRT